MEDNKRKIWSNYEIEFLKKNYSNMFNSELIKTLNRTEKSIHIKANRLGLKKTIEHKSKCIAKRNKMVGRNLTEEYLTDISKKYKTRSEFQKKDPSVYSSSRRKGLLDKICSHMVSKSFSIPQLILKDIIEKLYKMDNIIYNDRKTLKPYELDIFVPDLKIGFEYNGKGWYTDNVRDVLKKNISIEKNISLIIINETTRNYEQDIKNQLISNINDLKINLTVDDINDIVIDDVYSKVYDINDLKKIAESYTSFKEFYNNEKTVYIKLRKLKLVDEYTKHMCCRKKKREIDEIIEKINRYDYLIDLIKNDFNTYSYVKKKKLNHLLKNLKRIKN